jgi:Leucine-rich repeat (LRR) protein
VENNFLTDKGGPHERQVTDPVSLFALITGTVKSGQIIGRPNSPMFRMPDTPSYFSRRIQQAKQQQLKELDLSNDWETRETAKLNKIPDEVFELEQLEKLNLARNSLKQIPHSIARLRNLKTLGLSHNPLGEFPSQVLNLPNLTSLDLSSTNLQQIPAWVSDLENLKDLDISFNRGVFDLSSLGSLRNLVSLSLNGTDIKDIPSCISEMSALDTLDVGFNGLVSLPPWLSEMPSLKRLYLSGNQKLTLPEWLSAIPNLKDLYLGGTGLTAVPQWLKRMPQLKALDLSQIEAGHIPEWIGTLRNLQVLNLTECNLAQVPEWISQLEKLTDLELVDNHLTHVPDQLSQLQSLTSLNLSRNKLIDISESIFELENLETLWIAMIGLQSLSESIGKLRKLRWLSLTSNELTALPESMNQLQSLELLFLKNNRFESLPEVVWELTALKDLNLSNDIYHEGNKNQINEISARVLRLENLRSLNLQGNPLQTPPPEVVDKGLEAVLNYFRQIEDKGQDFLYEAKLLIVGEPGAGKTSFANKIQNPAYQLTDDQPHYDWDSTNNLILRYTYEFMPKGIITQFIVSMHKLISEENHVWKSGVILERDQTRAEVIEYYARREIKVRAAGKHKKDLMTVVTYELDKIHESYNRLRYTALIPCNCEACKNSKDPHFFSFDVLQQFIEDRQENIQCQRSYRMVDVQGLIDDVIDRRQYVDGPKKGSSSVVFQGTVEKVIIQQTEKGSNVMRESDETKKIRSAWANGSFYLFTFAVVIAGLGVLARTVPPYALGGILIAAIIFVPVIGALQLRQDDRLSEKSFLDLMKMVIGQLPLIGKLFGEKNPAAE